MRKTALECSETGARSHVAAKILEAAAGGEMSPEGLKDIARKALCRHPPCGAESSEVGVKFQVTVLKILISYPDGFAVMEDLERDMAILATSGRDWADRTRRLAARVPELDIFSQGLVERESGAWKITGKGRAVLEAMEENSSVKPEMEPAAVKPSGDAIASLRLPAERPRRRRERRERRRRTGAGDRLLMKLRRDFGVSDLIRKCRDACGT